jgi:hypothetical protein
MKTIFDTITVNYSEYSYFDKLDSDAQLKYVFEIYDEAIQTNSTLDLTGFFQSIHESLQKPDLPDIESYDSHDRVDVLIDDETIMIESNSLRAVRHIALKFVEAGYILARAHDMEKSFKKDKITRYMRIFKIIDQVSTICFN